MSKNFLKIENPGVADPSAFTLLGASTSRDSENSNTIGKFGSGNKHGVAVCLRHDAAPIVFAGSLRLTFGTTDVTVDTGLRSKSFARVNVKYAGKDRDGKSRTATEDLGFVLEYGSADWSGIDLALREFVSNAIDRAIEEAEVKFITGWNQENGITDVSQVYGSVRERFELALAEYRRTARPWNDVTIEIVSENQVRAKDGFTRVFVPLTEDVFSFYSNLNRWFLHFAEPDAIHQVILPKTRRNLNGRKAAVIYRRGVRVREFESSDTESLFDYNLNDLVLDEARKVDDWKVKHAAASALKDAPGEVLASVIRSFGDDRPYWEHSFDSYGLTDDCWNDLSEKVASREAAWAYAIKSVFGDNGVLTSVNNTTEAEIVTRKGFKAIPVSDAFVKAGSKFKVKTAGDVLSQDDRAGRTIQDADPAAVNAVAFAWNLILAAGLHNGRVKPDVKTFTAIMNGGSQTLGFYRDSVVYLNRDVTGEASKVSQQLLVTALEECVHHCTGATDCSRDFQDFLLNLCVKLLK